MAIFRGVGGSGDSSDNSFLDAVTAQANAASASATSAANSLAAIQQTEVTSASFDTSDGVLTLTKTGGATVTADLDGRFLTSYTETNDLSTAVTWANVPDANITQSSVTQHQAALSITESQISDLQTYLTAEANDLSTAVTWANVPDANITQSSVTQHQAALSITESQISDLQSYLTTHQDISGKANLSGATFTGNISFGDNNKINLGADNDLQIYHDGSDSYIDEQGTGDLILKGLSHIEMQRADTGVAMFRARPSRIQLFADGNVVASVVDDGVDITGDLTTTDTITTPNVDISTTGSVTTNIATGGGGTGNTKVLNLATGYGTGGSTTVNICPTSSTTTRTINLNGDVTIGGTLTGNGIAQTFTSRFSFYFVSSVYLPTSLYQLGYTYQTKETTGSKNTVDLTLETRHQDTFDTNDAEYYVRLTAPAPSDEDSVFLGNIAAVVADNTRGKKIGYFTGDKTKYFSEYCGLATNSSGTAALNTNGLTYYYDAANDRTYMGVHLYQTNNFNLGSAIYVHPFDWEASGTALNGNVTPLDAAVYDGTVESVHTKKHYLGYFKSNVNLEIYAQEPSANTDGNNVAIRVVEGAISQVQD